MREGATSLRQASPQLEQRFLALAAELEAMSRLGEEFVNQVETLVSLATGKDCDHSAFADGVSLIGQTTDFLAECERETVRVLERLQGYQAQVERLLGIESELERTMLPLKFVQTLFRVESAPLGAVVQQGFCSLTEEIEALHLQVREIFGTKFQQLEATRRIIGEVVTQLEEHARLLRQITTTHRARIQSSLATLQAEMTANQERDLSLGVVSKEIAREVGQVVIGVQFQDIVSQKLEHVLAALPRIEERYSEFQSARDSAAAREPLQYLHQCCRLEARQLQSARQELARAEVTIQGGIERVRARLAQMDSQCLSLEEFKLLTVSFDGTVQVLIETIEEVRRLIDATVAGASGAYERLCPLGGLASDLTGFVRLMSGRTHLLGLNAQIQAAQVAIDARGTGLEVIAARASEICDETNRISEEAARQLDLLANGLAECVAAFGEQRANGLAQQSVLNERGRSEEAKLHAFRDQALETLQAIGNSLDGLRAQTTRTVETIQFTSFHELVLPALGGPLDALADEAEQWLGAEGIGVADASLVESLRRDYTMASEREVLDQLVAAPANDAPGIGTGTNRTPGPPARWHDFQPAAARESAGAGEAKAEEPVPAGAGGDLGGNVELF